MSDDLKSIRIALVRHGRASAGWDTALDPELDELGRAQAVEVAQKLVSIFGETDTKVISSPLMRCQQTAKPFAKLVGADVRICSEVAEIPSPLGIEMSDRVDWLRKIMQGKWSDLDQNYVDFKNQIIEFVSAIERDTVVFSHFIAINAVIGSLTNDDRLVIRSLDNCSITVLERDAAGNLRLVQSGHEADTLIR
ncbi:MAG: histidine phosphatase family protein [Actinobacteria bacterium]|nr:histidine phosphatase family protein [Actinomycetota bacterium]